MNIERLFRSERDFFELPNFDLVKTLLRSIHKFGNHAKLFQTREIIRDHIIQNAIIWAGIGSHCEAAAFARSIGENEHENIFIPFFIFAFDSHFHRIRIEKNSLNDGCQIHQKAAHNWQAV